MKIAAPIPAVLLLLMLSIGSAVCFATVYQWKDADGNVQFSDRPPDALPAQAAQPGTASTNQARADSSLIVRVVPVDFRLHDRVNHMVESVPRAVDRIYRTRCNLTFPAQPTLTIRLLPDQVAYDRVVGTAAAPSTPDRQGAPATGELVTWYRLSPDAMAQALAGETSETLLRSDFPFAPRWLRAGLTRYFQLLRVLSDTTAVFSDPQLDLTVQTLRNTDRLLPTAELLSLSEPDWQRKNAPNQRAEAQAWSLVYFLMSIPEGGPLIGEILKRSEATAGDDSASTSVIDSRFPGGMGGLDARWRAWLPTHKAAHYY
jgi:hypothetical protein